MNPEPSAKIPEPTPNTPETSPNIPEPSPKASEPSPKTPEPSAKTKEKTPPKKRKPKSDKRRLVNLLIKVTVIAAVVWVTFTFVLGINIHYGNNMHPSIRDGDLVISLRVQKPYINSAVLYEHEGETCVGRVIALEGSTVAISDNGEITVNGVVPAEEVFYPTFRADSSEIVFPYTVPEGKVFILNDFRSDTYDSRTFGGVSLSDVHGNIIFSMRRRGF